MRELKKGLYNHFKNKKYKVFGKTSNKRYNSNNYKILGLAEHTETGELFTVYVYKNNYFIRNKNGLIKSNEVLTVYKSLYGDFKYYLRPLGMFLSEVQKEKYPEIKQKYRFEYVRK